MVNKINVYDCSLNNLSLKKDDIVLIVKVKDELKRIPFFIQYYKMIGINYFIFIDNNSSDNLSEFLLNQENTSIFFTDDVLSNHNLWVTRILETYCVGHWCLIVDLDEFFCFPYIENFKINQITQYLDLNDHNAVGSILLDMYPKDFLSDAVIKNDYSPISLLRFFDKHSHFVEVGKYYGGVRKRIFDAKPCLSKIPLIKYNSNMIIGPGMHSVKNINLPGFSTALLHCKFDSDFKVKIKEAIKTGVYWNNSEEYKKYGEKYKINNDFSIFDKNISTQYVDSKTLINSQIMSYDSNFDNYVKKQKNSKISLVLCTYGRNNIFIDLLKSIEDQSFDDFELIIVDNNEVPKIKVATSVTYQVIHEKNKGLSFARNRGIEHSVGEYIMFIDDDVILDKNCLENLLNGIEHYNSDLAGGSVILRKDIKSNLTKKERRFLSELVYKNDIEFLDFPKYIVGACLMVRRSVFMKYGFFLTKLGRNGLTLLSGEETEFIKRINKYGGKVSYINNAKCIHNIDLVRINFRYLLRRAFWQGVTEYIIDSLFDEMNNRRYKIFEYGVKNFILNVSRLIGYKLGRRYSDINFVAKQRQ